MTAPVIQEHSLNGSFDMDEDANAMAFYMKSGEDPEPKSDSDIQLEQMPPVKVYVRYLYNDIKFNFT